MLRRRRCGGGGVARAAVAVVLAVCAALVCTASAAPTQVQFDAWLRTEFRAADPERHDWCLSRLMGLTAGGKHGSQYDQDVFLARNLFAAKIMRQEPGFYVDSGANDWSYLSNTLLFERCFGWTGLCVEPNPQYHRGLLDNRKCKLLPELIVDKEGSFPFELNGVASRLGGDGNFTVKGRPLAAMLAEAGIRHVDLWSLDVEGAEMLVLQVIDWDAVDIEVLLIEDFWVSGRKLDQYLTRKGYDKFFGHAIDSVFRKRHGEELWLPPTFDAHMKANWDFREKSRDQLAKDF